MTAFSWAKAKQNAIDIKIRRAKTMATAGQNKEFKDRHPDWVRDAQQNNFVQLVKEIKEEVQKRQKAMQDRSLKLVGKD